jgi:lipopolysaccharide transport system permease protein
MNPTDSLKYKYDLIRHLVWRDFTLRYKGSLLGIAWSLLPPVAQLLVLVFLFRDIVPLKIESYPAFIFVALLPWTWFTSCVSASGSLFKDNRDLVRRPNFEPAIMVLVNTISYLINYLLFLPILLVMLTYYDRHFTVFLLFFPLLLLLQGILILGLTLIIATLNVFFYDIQHMANLIVFLLFYLTPIFYQSQSIANKYHFIFQMNPIAVLLQSYRAIFFYGSAPDWDALLVAGMMIAAILGFGYFIYRTKLDEMYDAI